MTAIDHQTLIAELDGAASVAEAIGALPVTVRAWAARNRIPPEHWPAIIKFAASKGLIVRAEWLMNTTPSRSRPDNPEGPPPVDAKAPGENSPSTGDERPFTKQAAA
jgi:hypothetical protein